VPDRPKRIGLHFCAVILSTSLLLTIEYRLDSTMADLEDTVDMIERLTIANNTSLQGSQQDEAELKRDVSPIVDVAKSMIRNAERFIQNPNTSEYINENLLALRNLSRSTARLTTITASIDDAPEILVMAHISSLSDQNSEVPKMLLYFGKELKAIIRSGLSRITASEPKLLRILEECYEQALDDSGSLFCGRYFGNKDEVCIGTLYDVGYQSKQYHVWIDFWSQALQTCPGGPTLFIHKLIRCSDDIPHTSRYLFRAFDSDSSRLSDDTVVASAASIYSATELDHLNILSRDKRGGSQRLHEHLTKELFGGSGSDNLMSWSNSLLFVIQYAIWRSNQRGWDPSGVHICAVDTNKFPRGQFARDMWLINQCYDPSWTVDGQNPLGRLIQLRKIRGYYNGEHLSQGTINHKGRSSVFSLQDLIDAGLCELYPELDDPEGRKGWPNRVLALRSMWVRPMIITPQDVYLATQLARLCFQGMPKLDLALIFLTFRNRKLSRDIEAKTGKFDSE
jgi:hypothetical protein